MLKGWYANALTYVGPLIDYNNVAVDSVAFLDIKRPFGYIDGVDLPAPTGSQYQIMSESTLPGALEKTEQLLGKNVTLVYCAPVETSRYNYYGNWEDMMRANKDVFPSYNLSFPKCFAVQMDALNNAIDDSLIPVHTLVYIPSLNIAYQNANSSNGSGNGYLIYDVVNGVFRKRNSTYFGYMPDGGLNVTFVVYDSSRNGFYGGISFSWYGDPFNGQVYHMNWRNYNRINSPATEIFKGNPDFEYDTQPPDDPYGPGGNSGTGDYPPGTFDDDSDAIPDSPLPTLSMADTGFTRIFNPTLAQVNSLAEYLWKTDDILETIWNKIKQVFENPMDVMIAFNIVPVPVPNGAPIDFTIMYIPTGVYMAPATNQFVDVDCGSVELNGYYGSALDYSPYTKVHCYLPFIGMVSLDTDEVMNHILSIKYRVDIVSGGCVAKIFVDGNVLYQYSGHCSISVPFSASDFSQYMNAMLKVSALAIGAAGAGIGAALGAGAAADAAQQTSQMVERTTITNTARNPGTGRQITTGTQTIEVERPEPTSTTKASYDGLSPANVVNTVGQVMGGKPVAQHSGSFNGNTGYLGVRYPYLVIERPRQCLPSNYQRLNGYPSMITLSLGSCTGYTRVQQVQLTGLSATNPEQAEILQLLKGGVVF